MLAQLWMDILAGRAWPPFSPTIAPPLGLYHLGLLTNQPTNKPNQTKPNQPTNLRSADAPSGLWTQILSALVFSSLPSLGCYVGAICCSRMQGFKAGMHATALRISCAFAVLAAMCGPLNSATRRLQPVEMPL